MLPTLKYSYFISFLQMIFLHFQNVSTYMVDNNPYHRKEILDTQGKYQLDWIVDWSTKQITFTVTAETHGAIEFGLSSKGSMADADLIIGGVFSNGKSYFKDFHGLGNQMPQVDTSQDWILHSAYETPHHTILEFSRLFDTCDPQDYPITEETISLIWSFSETDSPDSYQFNPSKQGAYQVHLLQPDYSPPIVQDIHVGSSLSHDHIDTSPYKHLKIWKIPTRIVMPTTDTTYWCTILKSPSLPHKHHQVGWEIVFPNEQSREHVHHLIITRCRVPSNSQKSPNQLFGRYVGHPGQLCTKAKEPIGPMPTELCTEFYLPWGVGGRPFFYPPHVALPFGSNPDEYYMAQVHYDNPSKASGILVEASINLYYTSDLRANEAGLMVVRHLSPGLTPSLLVPPMTVEHPVYGLCGSECSRKILPEGKGIHIFGLLLHSHNTGKLMRFQQFRGNMELPWIQNDDNYAPNYQQIMNLNGEVNVLPGDMLVVKCTYDNTRMNGSTTVGGFSTRQEMCAAWFYYYGKVDDFMQCTSQIEDDESRARQRFLGIGNVTWSPGDLEFIVNAPNRLQGLRVTQVSDNFVNWDEQRRDEFKRYILGEPHVNKCPLELGRTGSPDGILRKVGYPYEAKPYRPVRSCSFH